MTAAGKWEEWAQLSAQHEWLQAATNNGFAPWPGTSDERAWLGRLRRAHAVTLAAWRGRYLGLPAA